MDYFRWRQADAQRNALNAHCYWTLRGEDEPASQAEHTLSGLSTTEKKEFLLSRSIQFDDLPAWQIRGSGLSWETYHKTGINPQTGEDTISNPRQRIKPSNPLPYGDEYDQFLLAILDVEK